ncbi:UNVERIFIED_ORG: alginate O-acetyltransferase complex protein AlgJ [Rhizobium esperanzae]
MEEINPVAVLEEIVVPSPEEDKFDLNAALGYLPAVSILILFACGVGAFTHFWLSKEMIEHRQQPRLASDFIQGREALELERIYKEVFPIRDFSTGLLNAISFTVFDEARKGLIKGSDGWFFTDEEFTWNRKSAGMLEKHLSFVGDSVNRLKSVGIEPILLLIPEKADIYHDKLGKIAASPSREHYYEDVRSRLLSLSVAVPDLRSALLQAREREQVFLKSDTHWTVQGAGVVARSVAQILAGNDELQRKEFKLKPETATTHMGDLYKFAKLSVFSPLLSMPGEPLTPLSAVPADADLDDLLSDDNGGPQVAMVGSSYSANAKWSFEAQLKADAKVDVINFAEEGKGPFFPMEAFLNDKLPRQKNLKYVVWELPLRYFDEVSY